MPPSLGILDFLRIGLRFPGMIEKLRSRKFVALIVTTVISVVGREVGLSEEATNWLIGVAGAFIVGQGIADLNTVRKEAQSKLTSRKLWVYVVYTLATVVGDFLGLPSGIVEKVGTVVMTYLVGQGVADSALLKASAVETTTVVKRAVDSAVSTAPRSRYK